MMMLCLSAPLACSGSGESNPGGTDTPPSDDAVNGATVGAGATSTVGTTGTAAGVGGAVGTTGSADMGGSGAFGGSSSVGPSSTSGDASFGASTGGVSSSGAASTTAGGATTGGAGAGGSSGTASGGGSTGNGGTAGTDASGDGGTSAVGGSAGDGGTGGLPTLPDNGCNVRLDDQPLGFASMDGGTVGGGNTTPIQVTTEDQLISYLGDSEPRVLHVMNDLDFRTENRGGVQTCNENTTCDNGSGEQVEEPRVSATCDSNEYASTSYRYETRIDVASNKTVIGIGDGDGAALRGASLNVGDSEQVILRNLRIYDVNPHLVEAGDGVTMQGSSHIWLDHLLLDQISDGYVDIGSADHDQIDEYVTLSFIHFDGRTQYQCGGKHHYVNALDNSQVTYHHNWYDQCNGRNPKIGQPSSRVHLFNNYWLDVTYFCITAQTDSQARVESNYFENSSRPHWLQTDGNGTAGIAIDDGNVYTGASAGNTNRDSGGTVFSVPYAYTKESAADARQHIIDCSGPQPIQ